LFTTSHESVARLHTPAVHALPDGSHVRGVPTHWPAMHVSLTVQNLPSSHFFPSRAGSALHCPVRGLHTPTVHCVSRALHDTVVSTHELRSASHDATEHERIPKGLGHVRGIPSPHAPALHLVDPGSVQNKPSSQAVPSLRATRSQTPSDGLHRPVLHESSK
jgi:hypothetical protein